MIKNYSTIQQFKWEGFLERVGQFLNHLLRQELKANSEHIEIDVEFVFQNTITTDEAKDLKMRAPQYDQKYFRLEGLRLAMDNFEILLRRKYRPDLINELKSYDDLLKTL